MKRARERESGKSGIDLIEEATHLLRTADAATLAAYYLGAIPFVLGFLYFWTDMSQSPFANQHVAESALAITALFLWMKYCHTSFARRIRAQFTATPPPRLGFRRSVRLLLRQAMIQPSGLFILPLAAIFVLPFAWIYAFYQNVTVLADAEAPERSRLTNRAWRQACLWAGHNVFGLGIMFAFGLFVFLNWMVVSYSIPGLLQTLFGIDSTFNRSSGALLNSTFLAAMIGLTYLCVDPILKTIYTLRCFYGESLQSGEDLKAELKQYGFLSRHVALVAISIALACGTASGAVQGTSSFVQSSDPGVSPAELDRRIERVIQERKYTWRMPRGAAANADSEKGMITRFLERVAGLLRRALRAVSDWLDALLRRLFKSSREAGSAFDWMSSSLLLYVLLAVVLSALAVFLFRVWRERNRPGAAIATEPIQLAPDIADENIDANRLPEDGWTRLARGLLEQGEFRLAMRAFYLASLAHLASRNLIGIARFKSNRDYENELRRRGHALSGLLPLFGENLSTFERIWYGMHDVNRDLVQRFAENVDRIRTVA